MRRLWWMPLLALAACHAHQTAAQNGNERAQTLESAPKEKQVSSARPVRTTPGGMLDDKAMREIQSKLTARGYHAPQSGQLDQATQAALRKFQAHEHMAATGLPDYDTLRRLGLSAKSMYLGGTERRDEHERSNEAKR